MEKYADLEIGLHRRDTERYQIELRFSRPDSEVDKLLVQDKSNKPLRVRFDHEHLRSVALDDAAYEQLLGKNLFEGQEVRSFFAEARAAIQSLKLPLRVRLFIGPSAPELHSLRWEMLRDPQDGTALFTSASLLFSRYLSSFDWRDSRSVRLRSKADLRALVVIANPSDVDQFQLTPLNGDEELKRARSGLEQGNIIVTALDSKGSATLNNLVTHLRDGYDILYLIGHGKLVDNEPWLWLEDETGKTDPVAGDELVTRLRELEQRPRLVVLASCQSAGTGDEPRTGDEGVLVALGPRLAEVGIPAVVAMQGNVTIKTIDKFMSVFFRELQRDGQIDRAMAAARGAVRKRLDWWMPVLFMRLKSGRIWYVPGFTGDQQGMKRWDALVLRINKRLCTPILGPDLSECLLGSRRELARRWAEKYHFPMAPHNREELPHVAQYLAVELASTFPKDSLIEHVRNELLDRYRDDLPDTSQTADLGELLRVVGAQLRERNPEEPYRVLAELPFPIYINTNPGNLLEDALVAAGKEPQVEFCRWKTPFYDDELDYEPDEQKPLVYHLFGSLRDPESLTLTEDDYFDYLINVARKKNLIPDVVKEVLVNTTLLFMGFQIDDWNLRVMFRYIMSLEGVDLLRRQANVAAQITPEEERVLEPKRARHYFEQYFRDANISIYWGSTEDFVHELQERWKGGIS